MKWVAVSLCSILLLPLLIVNVCGSSHETLKMELIHRTALSGRMHKKPSIQWMREVLRSDLLRWRATSQRLEGRSLRSQTEEAQESRGGDEVSQTGLSSAIDFGVSQYLVRLRVGTPSQKVHLILDTGSELTWMSCLERCTPQNCSRRRPSSRGPMRRKRFFRPANSTSFQTVPCASKLCEFGLANMFSLAHCPTQLTPCSYYYSYLDGSSSSGIFAKESVRLQLSGGGTRRLSNMIVGCSYSSSGNSFVAADGVLGLGFSDYSFVISAAISFGSQFSYCLMDHWSPNNVSNFLTFGKIPSEEMPPSGNMQFTPLVLGELSPFYALNLVGMSVGGVPLNISSQVWAVRNGPTQTGTILDSGSSLTSLPEPAYKPLVAALKPALSRFKRLHLDLEPLDYCFDATGFDESVIPRLAIHFAGGAHLVPPVKSYIIAAADGVRCLGIISGAWPGISVIGNIMQQNHLWVFDLQSSKLGFVSSACS